LESLVPEASFNRWIPFQVVGLEKGKDGKERVRIRGIASTEHMDQDGDTIVQDGLDFSYFLKRGYFNDNHSKGTADVLGYPDKVYPVTIDDNGQKVRATAVEGYLLGTKSAKDIAELARELDGTPRQLGFSVEGPPPVRDPRDPNRIVKAVVRNVAITNCPVNPFTKLGLVKSMAFAKALSVGGPAQAPGAQVTGSARPLMPESLGLRLTLCAPDPVAVAKRAKELTDEWLKANGGLPLAKSMAERIIKARYPEASPPEVGRILALARRLGDPR
jgi:hypothetical protein